MTLVKTEKKDGIFYLGLNIPEKRNSLNTALMSEVMETLKSLNKNLEDLKALVIYGEGKSFCAGADLSWMKEMVDFSLEENIRDSTLLYDLFDTVYSFPLPIVTRAHGHVFGGGLGFLAASDCVVADKKTQFCFSEVKLGLAPAAISSFVLSKCSLAEAQALMTSGAVFNFETAKSLGLVQSSAESFEEILNSYQTCSQEALIKTKKLILLQRPLKPEQFKDQTIKTIASLRTTKEAQKRMNAFLNKKERS